jgi:hypothetical protein
VGEKSHACDPCWWLMEDICMICASLPVTSLSLLQSAGPSANVGQYRPMCADIGQRTGRSTLADMLGENSHHVGRRHPPAALSSCPQPQKPGTDTMEVVVILCCLGDPLGRAYLCEPCRAGLGTRSCWRPCYVQDAWGASQSHRQSHRQSTQG